MNVNQDVPTWDQIAKIAVKPYASTQDLFVGMRQVREMLECRRRHSELMREAALIDRETGADLFLKETEK